MKFLAAIALVTVGIFAVIGICVVMTAAYLAYRAYRKLVRIT